MAIVIDGVDESATKTLVPAGVAITTPKTVLRLTTD
jgi:hypothetical protein